MRWNKDRASAVLGAGSNTYDSRLLCAINNLSEEVLGKAIDTSFTVPNKYTGIIFFTSTFTYCHQRPELLCTVGHEYYLFFILINVKSYFSFSHVSGEKIGIEYLYGQTGQVLAKQDDLEEENSEEDIDDEGFHVCSK
jgi:hypothetical protein